MATVAGYILREIDKDLWDAVKARAARDGHNIRWVLLALLRSYVQHGLGLREDNMPANTPAWKRPDVPKLILPDREETYCQACGNAPDAGERCVICGRYSPESDTEKDVPQTDKSMTLGDFVKHLSALLQKNNIKMPFKNERAWHLAFYQLKTTANWPGRPAFLDSLVFDWDGRYPKSRQLSEFLHALHWNSSVSAGNPSYEQISLNPEIEALWLKPIENLDTDAQQFFQRAVEIANQEFAVGRTNDVPQTEHS